MEHDDKGAEVGPGEWLVPPPPPGGYGYRAPVDSLAEPPAGIAPGARPPAPGVRVGPDARLLGAHRRLPLRPSPVFGGLVAVMVAAGVVLWTSPAVVTRSMRVAIFVFVATGWVVSLCLHEFAHAAVAWKGGDRGVEARGYLTLDPRRYMNRQLSIVLPIIFVLIGGIALPGGAVMIDRRFIPSRPFRSLVSAAGPLTNLVCAIACGLPLALGLVDFGRHEAFAEGLAFLALLEVIATLLNSLPVPGLDGFGVIAPYLSDETVQKLMPIAGFAFFGIFILLFYSVAANTAFFHFCYRVLDALGVNGALASNGQVLFRFWRPLT